MQSFMGQMGLRAIYPKSDTNLRFHGDKYVIPAPAFTRINSSGNPEKYWIPGQARNDRRLSSNVVIEELLTYIAMYIRHSAVKIMGSGCKPEPTGVLRIYVVMYITVVARRALPLYS
ncbi:MAG: hypothetical protein QY310_10700 [Candidatus Jettenia sp. CY-1]|nr:MAG: hypothetical protein QY310_10700 [Candidatus Jettenia sp. CY-1]